MSIRQQMRHNSKGVLIKAIQQYQQALAYYANENHWAVKDEDILWIKDDDPTLPAQTVLGLRKAPKLSNNAIKLATSVREPDTHLTTIHKHEDQNA